MAGVPQAKPPSKASALTVLKVGEVEVQVGLFKATADPKKLVEFDTAGPHGGVLKAVQEAAPVPVEATVERETPTMDPLAELPQREAEEYVAAMAAAGQARAALNASVDGRYERQLVEEGYEKDGPVLPDQVRRGVRLDGGKFVDCTAQLAEIDERTKLDRIEILGFQSISALPRARVIGSYYIGAADENAPLPLRLIMEALKAERRCGVVKMTKRSRQSLGVIGWFEKSLMLYEIVWAECFRPPPAQATAIMAAAHTQAMVEQARELVRSMNVPASALDELRDDAVALREQLREQALAGEVPEVLEPDPVADAMPDVMAQIEATLAAVAS